MVETTEMHWAVTVNGKYIGHCPIDENYGLTTAEKFVAQAIRDKVIDKADTEFPHVTTYKVVPANEAAPLIPKKAVKTRTKTKTKTKKIVRKK